MQKEIVKQEHYSWIDALRFISVLLVIIIHVSTPLVNNWRDASFEDFMTGNIYDSLSRVSVPLFFMVSGYLLLSKQESILDFYRKRVKKILIPFLAWSILYLLWEGYYIGGSYSFIGMIKSIIYEIITKPTAIHLWFFYTLIGIYALVPVLRLFTSVAKGLDLWYFVGLWFLSGPVLLAFEMFTSIDVYDQFGFLVGYFGYFLLGYVLAQYSYSRKQALFFFWLYLALAVGTALGTWSFSVQKERLFLYLYNYLSPNIILMSASIFVVLLYWGGRKLSFVNSRMSSLFRLLGNTSFGVYLIHIMVQTSLHRGYFGFVLNYKIGNPLWSIPLMAVVIYFFSFVIVFLLRKIPVIRAIVW